MLYEIVVEGFALDVEVTHCVNTPPCPSTWSSDWDAQGERDIEFRILCGVEYDDQGHPANVSNLLRIAHCYRAQIETALWFEIDSRLKRHRRVA